MNKLTMQVCRAGYQVAAIALMLAGLSAGTSRSHAATAAAQSPSAPDVLASVPRLTPSASAARPQPAQLCQTDLNNAIASVVANPTFSTARWGILIQPVGEQTVLYEHNSNASLIPASNIKLLTTAAALQIVGDRSPQYLTSYWDWITRVNRDSHNSMADALLRRIGGQHAVRTALASLGINASGYAQVDGSGLSRSNRAQPSTFVSLLREMYTHPSRDVFYHSLAIAGVNGTLRNRFRDTSVQGRLYGKTGTLRGVRALSGYLDNAAYGTVAFSIVINQANQSGPVMTEAIDQIVLKAAQVNRCN